MAATGSTERPGSALVIVCGLPGSGKTTTAKQLTRARGGVRLNADEWMSALGTSIWDFRMRERVEALQWSVAQDLLRAGTTVVVEWGSWSRAERDTLRLGARAIGSRVELIHLHVFVDELWRRIQERGAEDPPIARSALDDWHDSFQAPGEAEVSLFDRPLP